jgi:hypothetical protein
MVSQKSTLCAQLLVACTLLIVTAAPALAADSAPAVNAAPATAATWSSIDENVQKLEARIAAGKIGDLGSAAYPIAHLLDSLPKDSSALPPADLAKVTASVKPVANLAVKCDKAGDKGDKAGVDAAFKAFKEALVPLRAI